MAAAEELNVPDRHVTSAGPAYVGAASCSTVGCHGGSESRPGDASAYRTWLTRDPHARAYAVLENARSRRMADMLAGRGRTPTPPTRDARCLNCHVYPDAQGSHRSATFALADGVSCESCHGPAEHWLESHWSEWPTRSPSAQARAAAGMVATSDVETRARLCAGCHVGGPGRDVNHDLIAAGHPRLAFEFSAFTANLPRHWDENKPLRAGAASPARAWAVGQFASAQAALDLLAWRTAGGTTTERGTPPRPWPELAEYACFSCHHSLASPSEAASGGRGSPRWGSWSYAFVPGLDAAGAGHADSPLGQLAREMSRPDPRPAEVHRLARLASEQCATALRNIGQFDATRLCDLIEHGAERGVRDQDTAAQMLLAASVLTEGLDARGKRPEAGERSALRRMLNSLRPPRDAGAAPGVERPLDRFGEALTQYLRATRTRFGP